MEQQRPERIADRCVVEPVEVGHHIQEAGVLSVGSSAGTRRSATAPASSSWSRAQRVAWSSASSRGRPWSRSPCRRGRPPGGSAAREVTG
jgi:hypothetical protein